MLRLATEELRNLSGITANEKTLLLEYVTGKSLPQMILEKTLLTVAEKNKFEELAEQRKSGTPLQLIVGSVTFLDFELTVEPGVFIPRPETEQLVEKAIELISVKPRIILEIGTGTGAIAIALARYFPSAEIIATDLSPAALSLAKRNAERMKVENRIRFTEANLFDFRDAEKYQGQFDLVISNPPYIPTELISTLPSEVRDFDPVLALDGGPNGFNVLKRILDKLSDFLSPDGFGVFEIDPVLDSPLKTYSTKGALSFNYGVDNYKNLRFLFVSHK